MIENSKGSKIYVDPFYFPNFSEYIEPLALLIDKIFVYNPTELLLSGQYPQSRFNEFVDEKIFTPIFISNPEEDKLEISNYIMRKDIIKDWDFFPSYHLCIEYDRIDEELVRLLRTNYYSKEQIDDLIYSLNWDLIVSQALNAYCLTPSVLKPVWEYKFSKAFEEEEIELMKNFLINYTLKIPQKIPIDKIKNLRKDKAAEKLRDWFKDTYTKLKNLKSQDDLEIKEVEVVLREFQKMLDAEEKKIEKYSKIAAAISSVFIGVIGFVVAPVVSPFSPLATIPMSNLIKKIWNKLGKNNWVFMIVGLLAS